MKKSLAESTLLRNILCIAATELPPDTISYAMEWSLGHVDDSNWAQIVQAVLRWSAPDKRKEFGNKCYTLSSLDHKGVILLAMVQHCGDPESIELANKWIREFWIDAQDSLIASMVVALLTKSPNPELLTFAKSLLPKSDSYNAIILLTALLDAGDVDAIKLAKKWLDTRRIERRWRSDHVKKGRLLTSLLAAAPKDPKVLEASRKCLSRPVESNEKRWKLSVQHAYDDALKRP